MKLFQMGLKYIPSFKSVENVQYIYLQSVLNIVPYQEPVSFVV
jgi:hypothetical protein